MTYLREIYYKAGSTILTPEGIKEIKESRGKIPNAAKKMSEKYHISCKRVYDLWNNCERSQQTIDNPEALPSTSHKRKKCSSTVKIQMSENKPFLAQPIARTLENFSYESETSSKLNMIRDGIANSKK